MLFWRDNTLFVTRTIDGVLTWCFLVYTLTLIAIHYSIDIVNTELVIIAIVALVYFTLRIIIHVYRLIIVLYGSNFKYRQYLVFFSLFTYPVLQAAAIVKRVRDSRIIK